MSMSTYLKNKVIQDNLITTTVYAALFTGEGTEVSAASYKRQAITFIQPSDGQTSNSVDVLFPVATETWGDITHVGIFDSMTGGNLLFQANAEYVKTIDISSQYKVPKNYLIIRLK